MKSVARIQFPSLLVILVLGLMASACDKKHKAADAKIPVGAAGGASGKSKEVLKAEAEQRASAERMRAQELAAGIQQTEISEAAATEREKLRSEAEADNAYAQRQNSAEVERIRQNGAARVASTRAQAEQLQAMGQVFGSVGATTIGGLFNNMAASKQMEAAQKQMEAQAQIMLAQHKNRDLVNEAEAELLRARAADIQSAREEAERKAKLEEAREVFALQIGEKIEGIDTAMHFNQSILETESDEVKREKLIAENKQYMNVRSELQSLQSKIRYSKNPDALQNTFDRIVAKLPKAEGNLAGQTAPKPAIPGGSIGANAFIKQVVTEGTEGTRFVCEDNETHEWNEGAEGACINSFIHGSGDSGEVVNLLKTAYTNVASAQFNGNNPADATKKLQEAKRALTELGNKQNELAVRNEATAKVFKNSIEVLAKAFNKKNEYLNAGKSFESQSSWNELAKLVNFQSVASAEEDVIERWDPKFEMTARGPIPEGSVTAFNPDYVGAGIGAANGTAICAYGGTC